MPVSVRSIFTLGCTNVHVDIAYGSATSNNYNRFVITDSHLDGVTYGNRAQVVSDTVVPFSADLSGQFVMKPKEKRYFDNLSLQPSSELPYDKGVCLQTSDFTFDEYPFGEVPDGTLVRMLITVECTSPYQFNLNETGSFVVDVADLLSESVVWLSPAFRVRQYGFGGLIGLMGYTASKKLAKMAITASMQWAGEAIEDGKALQIGYSMSFIGFDLRASVKLRFDTEGDEKPVLVSPAQNDTVTKSSALEAPLLTIPPNRRRRPYLRLYNGIRKRISLCVKRFRE